MARQVVCAGECGGQIWLGTGSLGEGESTCRSCRRAAWKSVPCETCGVLMVPKKNPGRFCSRSCFGASQRLFDYGPGFDQLSSEERRRVRWRVWDRRRRAALRSVHSEPYLRSEIGDRDGWVCQLCREPVDSSLDYPDPWSASVDHVVPLSEGGDDVRSNVQIAHLRCNLKKGAAGAPEQLRLVG